MLNVEKDRVEGVPGFDEDHWTDMADQSWTRQIHSYCGTEPYSNEARAQGVGVPEVR